MPVILLCCALLGMLGGGALIGRWALGVCLIADSLAVAVFALWHDWPERTRPQNLAVAEVLERARSA